MEVFLKLCIFLGVFACTVQAEDVVSDLVSDILSLVSSLLNALGLGNLLDLGNCAFFSF